METLYDQKKSICTIAEKLKRSPSTPSREFHNKGPIHSNMLRESYNKHRLCCARIGQRSRELAH
ncbi:helix-turn-helix domain-containing protein [Virgibacillus proomii]|uniref:helix-turn-helix domain-containing protein n=1 Tax=Virgibacillus proomii TaxID=84407 RepID=UPI003CCBB1FE